MPERKSHVKSRLGCSQCKARRVKCDEIRPMCGNCKRRQEACSYQNTKPTTSPSPDASGFFDHTNSIAITQHLKRMELMHHYSISTCHTLTVTRNMLQSHRLAAYQLIIPRLAFTHDFLLETVFAVTSLHLAHLRPEDARTYVSDAAVFHTNALTTFRQSLHTLNAEQSQALYYCSATLGIVVMAFRATDPETAQLQKPTELLNQLSTLWRGTGSIALASKELMDPVTYKAFFPEPEWVTGAESILGDQAQPLLEILRRKARSHSHSQDDESPAANEEARTVYLEAIDRLQGLFQSYFLDHSRVLAWVVQTPPQLMDYLEQGQALACAIVMMYSITMREMDGFWWAHGFRASLVAELAPVVSADPELAEIVHWIEEWTMRTHDTDVPPGHDPRMGEWVGSHGSDETMVNG